MEDMIFAIGAGSQKFSSYGHVNNFIKYLFSCSGKHRETEDTKKNFYLTNLPKIDGYHFVESSDGALSLFKKENGENLVKFSELNNDLFYMFFLIEFEGKIYTNLYEYNKEQDIYDPAMSEDIANKLSTGYFNGDTEAMLRLFGSMIETEKDLVLFDAAKRRERIIIESKVHAKIHKMGGVDEVMLAISHNDQQGSAYHIHRIYKDPEPDIF